MPFSLLLTSETGRISALACRQDPADSRITVLAVERHFGVAKLLRFAVPTSGEDGPITPEVIVDFACVIEGLPNYEGVAWSLQNDIYMLTDNNMGIEIGRTEGVVLSENLGALKSAMKQLLAKRSGRCETPICLGARKNARPP